jgi:DNA-binding beta-propeller fold protein YncE
VVHRDIKPENIMFQEGQAMLADFGIALAVKEAGGNRLTETGLSLGTPQYMSPEQATGDRALDARSDIYSLAAVLYEMLTGEPPVTGATAQAMIAKLMTERPTMIRTIRSTVPVALDATVGKALAKIPADRHAGAAEFSAALDAAMAPATPESTVPWKWIGVAAMAVVVAGMAITWGRGGGGDGTTTAPVTFGDERQVTFDGDVGRISLSPDGRTVAYLNATATAVIVVDLDGGGSQELFAAPPGSRLDGLHWSPDGSRLYVAGFPYAHTVWSVPRLGGAPRIELELRGFDATNGKDIRRLPSGDWLVVTNPGQVYRGPDPAALSIEGAYFVGDGVEQIPGVAFLTEEVTVVSSDGRWLGYVGVDSAGRGVSGILALSPGAPIRQVATFDSLEVVGWAGDDRTLYLAGNAGARAWDLLAVPFDPVSGRLSAEPVVVYPRIRANEAAITEDGRRLVFTSGATTANLVEVTLDGTPRFEDNPVSRLTTGTATWYPVGYTPAGDLLAVLVTDARYELYRITVDGTKESLFSRTGALSRQEIYAAPDGNQIAWVELSDLNLLLLYDLRTRSERRVTLPFRSSAWAFSADGTRLAGMSGGDAKRMLVVDSGATTARVLDLACAEICEFAGEMIDLGPEWPWAVITSEQDLWVVNLETGVLRQIADVTWGAVGWRDPWIYFYRTIGQTGLPVPVMSRVPAAGGPEERFLEMPLECGQQPPQAFSRDATKWTCAAVTNLYDITVVEIEQAVP